MQHQRLGDMASDRHRGVECGEGVLKDGADAPPQESPSLMGRKFPKIISFEDDLAGDVAAGTEQIENRAGNRALARAGLTHQAQSPAGRQRKRNVPNRTQWCGGVCVGDREMVKLQQRCHESALSRRGVEVLAQPLAQ